MPMYEGFFDHKDEKSSGKFMLKVRALDGCEAKGEFERECPDTHQLTAIALKNGHARQFILGHPMNTVEHSQYARTQRLLPPTDEALEEEESAQELARGAASSNADTKADASDSAPRLDDLKKRYTAPTSASLINFIGLILAIISAIVSIYLFKQEGTAIKVFALSVIPSFTAGLLLIAVAWSMKTLNRIFVASEYQAQLAEYRHKRQVAAENQSV